MRPGLHGHLCAPFKLQLGHPPPHSEKQEESLDAGWGYDAAFAYKKN